MSRKTTLKDIKGYADEGFAQRCDELSEAQLHDIMPRLTQVCYSCGVYGFTGGVYTDTKTGIMYEVDNKQISFKLF